MTNSYNLRTSKESIQNIAGGGSELPLDCLRVLSDEDTPAVLGEPADAGAGVE